MAKTQETKPPATKRRGPSHRITKYISAKSRLAIFRKIQSKTARSRKGEREDEPRDQEPPSETIFGTSSPSASEYPPAQPRNSTLPVPEHIRSRSNSPDPPLRYIQPKEIATYLLYNNMYKIDPRTGCTCGWYVFRSAICTHEFTIYRHTCGSTITKSCTVGFCKSPARYNHIDSVEIPYLCYVCEHQDR